MNFINFFWHSFKWGLGIGDWGLGVWGLGPNPKTQKPKTQNQNPKFIKFI